MMGCFVLNSVSERRLMRPVDRKRQPEPTKRKSFAVNVRFFTGFSELNNLNSGANAAFCERNNSLNFVFFLAQRVRRF